MTEGNLYFLMDIYFVMIAKCFFKKPLLLKKLLTQIALCFLGSGAVITTFAGETKIFPMLTQGIYAGFGGSLNTIDESFDSTLIVSTHKSGQDNYNVSHSQLAPMIQIGYSRPFFQEWLWGAAAQWKYLYYLTPNDDASQGQHLPNASFSSINFFGKDVLRDFNSQTRVDNEVLFLLYIGRQFQNGYAYLGIGPALFTVSNNVYVSSVHKPDGAGNHLIATSVSSHQTIWGGTVQVGYNLYLDATFFLNFNYTYSQTSNNNFNNITNTATLNGFSTPGPTTLSFNRSISLRVQEVMVSINKIFEI